MFWIGAASILIIFYSSRAYLNNNRRWKNRNFPQQFSRIYFLLLQGGNLILVIAGVLFLMLAIVSHVKGFEISFSSDFLYHMKILSK